MASSASLDQELRALLALKPIAAAKKKKEPPPPPAPTARPPSPDSPTAILLSKKKRESPPITHRAEPNTIQHLLAIDALTNQCPISSAMAAPLPPPALSSPASPPVKKQKKKAKPQQEEEAMGGITADLLNLPATIQQAASLARRPAVSGGAIASLRMTPEEQARRKARYGREGWRAGGREADRERGRERAERAGKGQAGGDTAAYYPMVDEKPGYCCRWC